jgi:16S rRNA processing protein RimM
MTAESDSKASSSKRPRGDADEWVAVGLVVGAFGVRGELKVESLTDVPERFNRLATVYVGDAHVPRRVAGARHHKQLILLTLDDVPDLTTAERLRGQRLWIPLAEIAPLPADSYYIHDLIGLRVQHVNGMSLGRVADVIAGGAGDLLLIRETPGGGDVLLPAVKEFIKLVDLAAGLVIVAPIPGLFDEQADEVRDAAAEDGDEDDEDNDDGAPPTP